MYLAIDNTETEAVVFFISHDGKEWHKFERPQNREGALLAGIDEILKEQNVEINKIKGVAVRVGKGRFTATRVATTVANTLSFALKIPVVAVKDIDLEIIGSQIDAVKPGEYIHALYSGEPRIGNKD